MDPDIVYSDKDLIVINKPPGIAVHSGGSVIGRTLVDFLLENFPEIKGVGDDPKIRPGIVHRLDKNTSGIMVVARNQKSFALLKKLFQSRSVEKVYQAIVCGKPREREGIITYPIGRMMKNPLKRGIEQGKSKIRGAREAVTKYKVMKSGDNYSLMELRPKTGRMHQIRVHLKAIGNPVACDKVYGGENVCCPKGSERQLLHAKSLSFSLPEGRKFSFEADPPEDFMVAERQII